METREQKEARLTDLKARLLSVEGTPTEVYSRIVGYYRSVRNWNAGKREEFGKRREYIFPSSKQTVAAGSGRSAASLDVGASVDAGALGDTGMHAHVKAVEFAETPLVASYLLFARSACPNCPPVKEYLGSSGLPGVVVDVDTVEGFELAKRYDVLSTPTALLLDSGGSLLSRAHSRKQLVPIVEPVLKTALGASMETVIA